MDQKLHDFIIAMPKVELHNHIEGAFYPELSKRLAEKAGVPLPENFEDLFNFRDLASFLEFLDWNCGLVKTPEDAESVAYEYCKYFHSQNAVYVELITNPTHWSSLPIDVYVPALLKGFDRAAEDGLCDARLMISLLRTQTTESAAAEVDWMIANPHPRMIALSVDGNEAAAVSNERFAPLYKKAKEAGYRLTAHCGESSDAVGVQEALDILKTERIDHGVRAIDDPALCERLKELQIPLNVCYRSNVIGGLYTWENHPLKAMYEMGLNVNVNTDDPLLTSCLLNDEYLIVCEKLGWGPEDLKKVCHNAINGSFLSDERKAELMADFDAAYEKAGF